MTKKHFSYAIELIRDHGKSFNGLKSTRAIYLFCEMMFCAFGKNFDADRFRDAYEDAIKS